MSLYEVKLMPKAQKDLDDFSGKQLSRFENIILGLYDDARPRNSKSSVVVAPTGVSERVIIESFTK